MYMSLLLILLKKNLLATLIYPASRISKDFMQYKFNLGIKILLSLH